MQKNVLIIPCYNEEKRLDTKAFLELAQRHNDIMFMFVNDGSKDNTLKVLQSLAEAASNITASDLPQNVGKAEAVRQGVLTALAAYPEIPTIAFYDADLATPFNDLNIMIDRLLQEQLLMIAGCRFKRLGGNIDRRFGRFILGRIFATVAANILKLPVYDTQCGAKVFSHEIAQQIFKQPFVSKWLFDIELFARIINIHGYPETIDRVVEYPLTSWKDIGGSKLKFSSILRQPINLLKIHRTYRKQLKAKRKC